MVGKVTTESYHVKEPKKLDQKHLSKVTMHFVWGHLLRKQTVSCKVQVFFQSSLQLHALWYLRVPDTNPVLKI